MLRASRRRWRLFYLAMSCVYLACQAFAQGPTLTTVSDTVYRADGSNSADFLASIYFRKRRHGSGGK
jgi:hypothetical protein